MKIRHEFNAPQLEDKTERILEKKERFIKRCVPFAAGFVAGVIAVKVFGSGTITINNYTQAIEE